ncbi:MAG TPA: twin-arginine translocase TatA/TatE family subunit [Nitrospinota bacterium]|nr:twin-arginine translocase TatA/TatE family subunit [Nitrospinota bacterium]
MFGLGLLELIILLFIILLVFGLGGLTGIGKNLAEMIVNFKKSYHSLDEIDVTPKNKQQNNE